MTDTRAVIDEFWVRHRARDASVVDLFADEIEFFAPGDPKHFPWAGRRTRGGAELLEAFEAMWQWKSKKGARLAPTLIVDGENAAWIALGNPHELEDPSGESRPVALDVVVYFTVRNGKIVRFHVIEDVTPLTKAYGFS